MSDVTKSLRAFVTSPAGFANVLSPPGLRTSAGFAKGKTLRKASGRYRQQTTVQTLNDRIK